MKWCRTLTSLESLLTPSLFEGCAPRPTQGRNLTGQSSSSFTSKGGWSLECLSTTSVKIPGPVFSSVSLLLLSENLVVAWFLMLVLFWRLRVWPRVR